MDLSKRSSVLFPAGSQVGQIVLGFTQQNPSLPSPQLFVGISLLPSWSSEKPGYVGLPVEVTVKLRFWSCNHRDLFYTHTHTHTHTHPRRTLTLE